MNKHLQGIKEAARTSGFLTEEDPLNPYKISLWKESEKEDEWIRILGHEQELQAKNGTYLLPVKVSILKEIRQSWQEKLLKLFNSVKPEELQMTPSGKRVQKLSFETRQALLIWSTLTSDAYKEIINEFIKNNDVENIGPKVSLIYQKTDVQLEEEVSRTDTLRELEPEPKNSRPLLVESDIDEPTEKSIEEVNELITRVEHGAEYFNEMLTAKLNSNPSINQNESVSHLIQIPYKFIKANSKNPLRNAQSVRQMANTVGLDYATYIQRRLFNTQYFSYDLDKNNNLNNMSAEAAFVQQQLRMVFKTFDPQNIKDLLVLYHETMHAMHNGHWRTSNWDEYYAFYTVDRQRVVINEEFDAYPVELEALNIMLGGKLFTAASNKKPLEVDRVAHELNLRSDQLQSMESLLNLAMLYFPTREIMNGNEFSEFSKLLILDYSERDVQVFLRAGDRSLKEIIVTKLSQ